MKKCILLVLAVVLGTAAMRGQTTKESTRTSDWTEVQTVIIPSGTTIHEGVTRNGNPKFWIEIAGDTKVTVSPNSATKFQAGEIQLELVKWHNSKTGAYKYSTRQVKDSQKKSKNLDLSKLF